MFYKIWMKIKSFIIHLFGGYNFQDILHAYKVGDEILQQTGIVIDEYVKVVNTLRYEDDKPLYAEYSLCEMCTNKHLCDQCNNMNYFTLFNIDYISKHAKELNK